MLDKEIIDEWYEKAKHIKNPDELKKFIEYIYILSETFWAMTKMYMR